MDHMHQVLVYADSLTWGIIPNTRQRLPFDDRWPGVLENKLVESGLRVRVIEDCLNGRRTVWEDPFKTGRNGRQGLAQRIASGQAPVDIANKRVIEVDPEFVATWAEDRERFDEFIHILSAIAPRHAACGLS